MVTGRSSGDWESSSALQKVGRMAQMAESVSESNARLQIARTSSLPVREAVPTID